MWWLRRHGDAASMKGLSCTVWETLTGWRPTCPPSEVPGGSLEPRATFVGFIFLMTD